MAAMGVSFVDQGAGIFSVGLVVFSGEVRCENNLLTRYRYAYCGDNTGFAAKALWRNI